MRSDAVLTVFLRFGDLPWILPSKKNKKSYSSSQISENCRNIWNGPNLLATTKIVPQDNGGTPGNTKADASRYLKLSAWTIWQSYKSILVRRVLPTLLVVLSLVEILGAIYHVFESGIAGSWKTALDLSLSVTAGFLVLHHYRQRAHLKNHDALLGTMKELLLIENERGPIRDEYTRGMAISEILQGLVLAAEYRFDPSRISATLLRVDRSDVDGKFEIIQQCPANTFPMTTRLDPKVSTAAKAKSEPAGTVIYLPQVEWVHAVRIPAEDQQPGFITSTIISEAFEILSDNSQQKVKSLLCTPIPAGRRHRDEAPAVLCLASPDSYCFKYLDFSAITIAANLIALAMNDH